MERAISFVYPSKMIRPPDRNEDAPMPGSGRTLLHVSVQPDVWMHISNYHRYTCTYSGVHSQLKNARSAILREIRSHSNELAIRRAIQLLLADFELCRLEHSQKLP